MNKEEKKLLKTQEKQDRDIISTLKAFLKHFDRAWYSIKEPVKELEQYFDLTTDWDWVVYVHIKTKGWDYSMGYTTDVDAWDIQTMVNWLKRRAEITLRHMYNEEI